jgi:hypothetical protein
MTRRKQKKMTNEEMIRRAKSKKEHNFQQQPRKKHVPRIDAVVEIQGGDLGTKRNQRTCH